MQGTASSEIITRSELNPRCRYHAKALLLLVAMLVAGLGVSCTTYLSYSKSTGIADPPSQPSTLVHVFWPGESVDRPHRTLGVLSIGDTGLTTIGGSFSDVVDEMVAAAKRRGADAARVLEIKPPDAWSTIYRIRAELVQYTTEWESVQLTEAEFDEYLAQNSGSLNPIEGVWSDEDGEYRIAIKRDDAVRTRDFVAYVLESTTPGWAAGQKKMQISKSASASTYVLEYYDARYVRHRSTFTLDSTLSFSTDLKTGQPDGGTQTLVSRWMKLKPTASESARPQIAPGQVVTGSGFLCARSGVVATNWHVVDGATNILVQFASHPQPHLATLLRRDQVNDLAVLQLLDFDFDSVFGSAVIPPILPSTTIKIGSDIFTLGFPLQGTLSSSVQYSGGQVSAVMGPDDDPRLIQITAPIQPGSSGSALFDAAGIVRGVVVSTLSPAYVLRNNRALPQNVNFAIRSEYLLNLMASAGVEAASGPPVEESPAVDRVQPFVVRIEAKGGVTSR